MQAQLQQSGQRDSTRRSISKPLTVPEPFMLQTEQRSEVRRELKPPPMTSEERELASIKPFRALPLNSKALYESVGDAGVPRLIKKPLTTGVAPVLRTSERALLRKKRPADDMASDSEQQQLYMHSHSNSNSNSHSRPYDSDTSHRPKRQRRTELTMPVSPKLATKQRAVVREIHADAAATQHQHEQHLHQQQQPSRQRPIGSTTTTGCTAAFMSSLRSSSPAAKRPHDDHQQHARTLTMPKPFHFSTESRSLMRAASAKSLADLAATSTTHATVSHEQTTTTRLPSKKHRTKIVRTQGAFIIGSSAISPYAACRQAQAKVKPFVFQTDAMQETRSHRGETLRLVQELLPIGTSKATRVQPFGQWAENQQQRPTHTGAAKKPAMLVAQPQFQFQLKEQQQQQQQQQQHSRSVIPGLRSFGMR